jgi:hypothetical protein
MANRKQLALQRALKKVNSRFGPQLVEVEAARWPVNHPPKLIRILRSRDYLVQVYGENDGILRLSIVRAAVNLEGRWADGIPWETLQALKDEAGYAANDAVEIFPCQADIVNVSNMRHLWVLPDTLSFGWRNSDGAAARYQAMQEEVTREAAILDD